MTTKPAGQPSPGRVENGKAFEPPRLTPLGKVGDLTQGTGSVTTTDGFFGS